MKVLEGIWRDLIDKRLWPIAIALAVVIIAVPVVLARSGEPNSDDVTAAAVAAGAGSVQGPRPAVIVAAGPGDAPTEGSLRNPFSDQRDSSAAGTPGAPAVSETGPTDKMSGASGAPDDPLAGHAHGADQSTNPSDGGPTDGGETGDAGSGSSTSGAGQSSGENGYDVSLRFGSDEAMKTYSGVPRLTPLPSVDVSRFVYLGVLAGGKTAVFMMTNQVTGVGDGTCRPSASACETLEMQVGDTMFLDVTTDAGQTKQYQFDLKAITKIGNGGETLSASEAGQTADTADADASSVEAGRQAVRRARSAGAADTLDRYRFDRAKGVVVRRPTPASRRARPRARGASTGDLWATRGGPLVAAGP